MDNLSNLRMVSIWEPIHEGILRYFLEPMVEPGDFIWVSQKQRYIWYSFKTNCGTYNTWCRFDMLRSGDGFDQTPVAVQWSLTQPAVQWSLTQPGLGASRVCHLIDPGECQETIDWLLARKRTMHRNRATGMFASNTESSLVFKDM